MSPVAGSTRFPSLLRHSFTYNNTDEFSLLVLEILFFFSITEKLHFHILYQTAVAVGVEPDNKLPYNEYFEYFGPDYTLHVEPLNMENMNSPKDMEKIR